MSFLPDRDSIRAHRQHQKMLMSLPNVIGVGIGQKHEGDEYPVLVVLVQNKVSSYDLKSHEIVPQILSGLETDVVEIGRVTRRLDPTKRFRPIPCGVSIGHYLITAGTFGARVWDAKTGKTLMLSNNHVFADENAAALDDAILQPGPYDGGSNPADKVATLERYMRIGFDGSPDGPLLIAPEPAPDPTPDPTPTPNGCLPVGSQRLIAAGRALQGKPYALATTWSNLVDAAVAAPVNPDDITGEIPTIGFVSGTKEATIGQHVRKFGRTTSYTEGTIIAVNATIKVGYGGNNVATFINQLISGAGMSAPGDSGSLLVDGDSQKAVGLLFAGSDNSTIFNPIDVVCQQLGVSI